MDGERKFRLVNDENIYTAEEIRQKIFSAELSKETIIWEPALPDWVKLCDYSVFAETLAERERIAREALAKAMGTDQESLERDEMRWQIFHTREWESGLYS